METNRLTRQNFVFEPETQSIIRSFHIQSSEVRV